MPRFEDANGVLWDIRTTSVTVNQESGSSYVATLAEDSQRDYSGNAFALDDDETFPAGTFISWPANGNPLLRGKGGESEAQTAIKQFAARDRAKPQASRTLALRVNVKPKPKDEGLPWWAVVAIAYAGYRLLKKSTGGRYYRGD